MIRSAPDFWGKEPGLAANLLLPIGAAWDTAGRIRRALARTYHPPAPVICVGNLVAGGAGKTPVVLALAAYLTARGIAVHVVTRGYGGRLAGPVRVDPERHDAAAVGDEALLLASRAPCWVARARGGGVAAAIAAGATAILLDDGFQNPSIAATLGLIVIDAAYGFGNGRVMPAGPLRESLRRGLARANGIVLLGTEGETRACRPIVADASRPIVPAVVTPVDGARLSGSRAVAFAGIGRPEKFFATVRGLGVELVAARRFPDHHPFRFDEIAELRRTAARENARLVTTAKDYVRVPPAARAGIEVLEVEVHWPDLAALDGLLGPDVLSAQGDGYGTGEYRR
jgi:tetraacyldisaccharide 4'-kinase